MTYVYIDIYTLQLCIKIHFFLRQVPYAMKTVNYDNHMLWDLLTFLFFEPDSLRQCFSKIFSTSGYCKIKKKTANLYKT